MKRVIVAGLAGLVLSACAAIQPPTPTPVNFVLPTNTPEPLPTTPAPTAVPTQPTPTVQAPGTLNETILIGPEEPITLTFEAGAGEVRRVSLTVIDGSPLPQLTLRDPFNNTIAQIEATSDATEATIDEITLPFSGVYSLEVISIGDAGSVTVEVSPRMEASGGADADPFSGLAGSFPVGRVFHVYSFPFTQGDVLTLRATTEPTEDLDLRLQLIGPDGKAVTTTASTTGTDPNLRGFIPQQTGTYTLIVTNSNGNPGSYQIQATSDTTPPPAAGDADLGYGQSIRARFADGDPLRLRFDGARGDVIAVRAFDLTEEIDLDMLLISPFDQVVAFAAQAATGEDEVINEFQLPYDGQYTLELRPTGDGEASLVVDQLGSEILTGGGSFGTQDEGFAAGAFNAPTTFHVIQFEAQAGDRITLRMRALSDDPTFDPGFALLAPNGQQQVFADDSEGGESRMPLLEDYVIQQNGTHTVIIYTFTDGVGRYELEYERN